MEPSKDDLFRVIRKKDDKISALMKQLKADSKATRTTIEKGLWALCFALCEKHVVCPECAKKNAKPWAAKSGYVLCKCHSCGKIFNQNKSKGAVFNAYFNNIKRAIDECE